MIPAVALQDLGWLVVVLTVRQYAPSVFTRRLLTAMATYVLVETLFHYPMETAVSYLFRGVGL